MDLEYTPEQKSRLEIEKLYAEVVDLRSWVRRWLGTLGGLLGIVTAAASVVVTSTQWSRSTREADLKMKQAEARLAQADKRDADKALEEIRAKTDATTKELEMRNGELAALEKRLAEASQKLASATESARALAVAARSRPFSAKALDLIVEAEGLDQPGRWPGGNSGIALGIGYDLGLVTRESFESDWNPHLSPEQIARLSEATGVTGKSAQALAPRFADIVITREAAIDVFERVTLPQWVARTAEVFPGFDKLPLDAQGALVALVFNRGTSLGGDQKKEMRTIRDLVPSGDLTAIAREIRAMKRLWEGKAALQGLLKRRDAEAALLESAK
jgi:GH24 family phage-related lysozyme (muramidase)